MKFNKLIFIFLSVVILIGSVLPVILNENAAISFNSAPALVFGICSSVYAIIAFVNKEQGNLFVLGRNKLFIAFLRSRRDDNLDTNSDEYKKEFALSAFIFCASIPLYIPLAFFAKSFYTALSSALSANRADSEYSREQSAVETDYSSDRSRSPHPGASGYSPTPLWTCRPREFHPQ